MKNDFMKSLDSLKLDINDNFNNINNKLVTIKSGFKLVTKKSSLLHQDIEKLESHILVLETDLNKQDQYNISCYLHIQ